MELRRAAFINLRKPHGFCGSLADTMAWDYPANMSSLEPSPALDIMLDLDRQARMGLPEAILCAPKAPEHLVEILAQARQKGKPLLLTRLSQEQLFGLGPELSAQIDYEPLSRTGFFGEVPPLVNPMSRVAVVAAGTSDVFVTREIERTLRFVGHASTSFMDVGLAGLWRLMSRIEEIKRHPIVIVVAGMDAALPTVLGGLVSSVVFAVPTSVGYGVAAGGESALRATLASCSAGLAVLNIDNGFGAACAAVRVLAALDRAASAS